MVIKKLMRNMDSEITFKNNEPITQVQINKEQCHYNPISAGKWQKLHYEALALGKR